MLGFEIDKQDNLANLSLDGLECCSINKLKINGDRVNIEFIPDLQRKPREYFEKKYGKFIDNYRVEMDLDTLIETPTSMRNNLKDGSARMLNK